MLGSFCHAFRLRRTQDDILQTKRTKKSEVDVMRSSVATAILILLVCFPLSASAKELTARVVDQNGQPIEAVSVITNVEGLGTKTDSSGWCKLEIPESVNRVTF